MGFTALAQDAYRWQAGALEFFVHRRRWEKSAKKEPDVRALLVITLSKLIAIKIMLKLMQSLPDTAKFSDCCPIIYEDREARVYLIKCP